MSRVKEFVSGFKEPWKDVAQIRVNWWFIGSVFGVMSVLIAPAVLLVALFLLPLWAWW